ncbi:MAG: purine-nucleoside phosphorylase [Oscillospiraceae bacterium]|nr:purine-nucleoside phosphorylase [Oscillospiraceae bacterium]
MNPIYEKLCRCLDDVRKKTDFVPELGLVLGSGLGDFADEIEKAAEVNYADIQGFPVSTVPGHKGRFVFGYVGDVKVVVMQGRVHYYEGYPLSDVVLPVRLMGLMGADKIMLTNAAGGVNPEFNAGDLMLIKDQIMFLFPNPLVGQNIDDLGVRFPDMSHAYDSELCQTIRDIAKRENIPLREGVYCQLTGPSFETPAEVRMLGMMGVDAVGMSTACEVVAANHMGLRVCGISCISNKGAGLSPTPLTHEEVQEAANIAAPRFKKLLRQSIMSMGEKGRI